MVKSHDNYPMCREKINVCIIEDKLQNQVLCIQLDSFYYIIYNYECICDLYGYPTLGGC